MWAEILAPAGDQASLEAALSAGADAVYFGLNEGLNARIRAGNFSLATLPDTCNQIHRAGARAYLTLNTLIFEEELEFVQNLIAKAAEAGVDALIVQDPAVALLAKAVAPTLEIHASTQLTISSPEAAVFAEGLGVTRVVVPRELSIPEIQNFSNNTSLELEVFVHGALCMSWSGQCLTSEAWGGRSANRGQCAQSCRLPYTLMLDGKAKETPDLAYLLSPLDLAAAPLLPELLKTGVHGLKIEGRLKGPGYVYATTEGYKNWRNQILAGKAGAEPDAGMLLKMAIAYSRGFSNGFLGGSDHQKLVEGRFPKHRGVLLGVVETVDQSRVWVRAEARPHENTVFNPELAPGMGIGFDRGEPEREEPGGPLFKVEPTPTGWLLQFGRPGPDLNRVVPGNKVWLTSEPQKLRFAEPEGRIPVEMTVDGAEGSPLRVRLLATGPVGKSCAVEASSTACLSRATGAGIDPALIRDKLGGFGGSPFFLASFKNQLTSGLYLPLSLLKPLKRQLLEQLETEVLQKSRHITHISPLSRRLFAPSQLSSPTLIPLCRTEEQLDAVIEAGFSEVELDWMELVGLARAVQKARAAGLKVGIATVRVQKPGEDGFDRRIASLTPDSVLVRHWGGLVHFSRLKEKPVIHGDFSLNVTNSLTANYLLGLGLDSLTAAHDLDEKQLFALLTYVPAEKLSITLHHHISTFHTEHCVYAHLLSSGKDWKSCGRPCEKHRIALKDPVGLEHPVIVDAGCRNTVFNAKAQSAAGLVPKFLKAGIRRFRVEFVWESKEQTFKALLAYQQLLTGDISPAQAIRQVAAAEAFGVSLGTMRVMGA
jgi:putative protease